MSFAFASNDILDVATASVVIFDVLENLYYRIGSVESAPASYMHNATLATCIIHDVRCLICMSRCSMFKKLEYIG